MELDYVKKHTIFDCIVGSHAYGISRPESDYDKAGVMIPGKEFFLSFDKFEQFQGFPNEDHTVYDIRKILLLIHDNNPNCMDLLWVPEHCVLVMTPYWEKVMEVRDWFVSKRCRYTFSGYAIAQLERIKTHRRFLLNPLKGKPNRTDYGLPDVSMFPTAQIKAVIHAALDYIIEEERPNFIDELDGIYGDYVVPLLARFVKPEERSTAMDWLQVGIKAQANTFLALGNKYLKEEYYDIAKKELEYYEATKEWERYVQWQKTRNKKRAEFELLYGYDTKHAAHLVRLMNMGAEILATGKVNVDRTNIDAELLRAIRNGAWTYDQVENYAEEMDEKLGELYKTSTLQKHPQRDKIRDLCTEIVDRFQKDFQS